MGLAGFFRVSNTCMLTVTAVTLQSNDNFIRSYHSFIRLDKPLKPYFSHVAACQHANCIYLRKKRSSRLSLEGSKERYTNHLKDVGVEAPNAGWGSFPLHFDNALSVEMILKLHNETIQSLHA